MVGYYLLILIFLVFSFFWKGIRFLEKKSLILKRAEKAEKSMEKKLLNDIAKKNEYLAYFHFFLSGATILSMILIPYS